MVCVDVNEQREGAASPLGGSRVWIGMEHPFWQARSAPRCWWVPLGFSVPLGGFAPRLKQRKTRRIPARAQLDHGSQAE